MLKKPIVFAAMLLSTASIASCGKGNLKITSDYYLVVPTSEKDYSYAHQINEALGYHSHFTLPIIDGQSGVTHPHEIIIDMNRTECSSLSSELDEDGYIIKEDNGKIIIAYKTYMARMCAVDHLLTVYGKNGISFPKGQSVKGTCKADDVVIDITLPEDPNNKFHEIRDPFIVKANDAYYMYGTSYWDGIDWRVYKSTSLKGEWNNLGPVVHEEGGTKYPDIDKQRWAPEVHKYKDKYYMFTTYSSKKTNQRGVTILGSDSPEGPFEMISKNPRNDIQPGHITYDFSTIDKDGKPAGCTIDGTLYVDPQGQPWLVYVNEWVSQTDEVGRFSAAKLSEDLSTIDESSNTELFRADVAPWAPPGTQVTDGCFIHKMPSGRLIMLWSANNGDGYSTAFATSDNGILGNWTHHKQQLFAAGMYAPDSLEGGHSMIFEDNGQLFMCQHGPNGGTEHPIIVPIKETSYNTLAWDIYNYINKK